MCEGALAPPLLGKVCFKCLIHKSFSEFYRHAQMKDGYLNKCKYCTKSDVTENRNKNTEYYREYDRKRGSRQDENYLKEYRSKYPNKHKAHNMVNNYIRDGKLSKGLCCETCLTCDNLVAHHQDYLKPLAIEWLCQACHVQWHKVNGEGLNGR